MKKILFFTATLLLLHAISITPTALAEDGAKYYEVTSKSAQLYERADKGSFAIFQIVNGCYVKKIGKDVGDFRHVSYMGVEGYILADSLSEDTSSDLKFTGTEYYHETITFYLSDDAVLTAEPGGKRALVGVDFTGEFTLLGVALQGGKEFACTKYGTGTKDFGYVAVADTTWMPTLNGITAPTIYFEPSPSPVLTPSPSIPASDTPTIAIPEVESNGNTELIRILLIVGICVPVAIVLVLIFRPVKEPYDRYAMDRTGRSRFDSFDDVDG